MTDIKGLGYVKIQTNDLERWRTFAFDVLGFAQGTGPDEDACTSAWTSARPAS